MLVRNDVQWLLDRRKGIGASDAAAVCGLSKWRTPLHVYLDKVDTKPPKPFTTDTVFGMGHLLEPICAKLYANETKETLYKPPPIIWHDTLKWMFASVDYWRKDRIIVECKTARSLDGWGEPGTDQVPVDYLLQTQHQMEVVDVGFAEISLLVGGRDHYIYTIARDYEIGGMLIEQEYRFMQMVWSRTPPEPDWAHTATPEIISKLYTKVEPRTITLGEDALLLSAKREEVKAKIKELESEADAITARMQGLMGDAERAELPGGEYYWTRGEVNRKGYEVQPTTYISFTPRKKNAPKPKRGTR